MVTLKHSDHAGLEPRQIKDEHLTEKHGNNFHTRSAARERRQRREVIRCQENI